LGFYVNLHHSGTQTEHWLHLSYKKSMYSQVRSFSTPAKAS
jgi:hypothetical protein